MRLRRNQQLSWSYRVIVTTRYLPHRSKNRSLYDIKFHKTNRYPLQLFANHKTYQRLCQRYRATTAL